MSIEDVKTYGRLIKHNFYKFSTLGLSTLQNQKYNIHFINQILYPNTTNVYSMWKYIPVICATTARNILLL